MGNELKSFGNGSMVWTIVYRDYNGKYASQLVYGSPDTKTMLEEVLKEYKRLVALIPGNQRVTIPPQIS